MVSSEGEAIISTPGFQLDVGEYFYRCRVAPEQGDRRLPQLLGYIADVFLLAQPDPCDYIAMRAWF